MSNVAATTRVAGEATEADRLDSRALLEAEHEVRVVQYAMRTSASFRESASSSSWTRHSLRPAASAGAVLVKSAAGRMGDRGKTDTVSIFLGERVGQKTQNQGGVNLTDVCKIGFH